MVNCLCITRIHNNIYVELMHITVKVMEKSAYWRLH